MSTLKLTLKKEWFDMIFSGEKKEEYREVKPYWAKRLTTERYHLEDLCLALADPEFTNIPVEDKLNNYLCRFVEFDFVEFTNGYGDRRPRVTAKFDGIYVGVGNYLWGAPVDMPVFIIRIGEIISIENLT